MAFIMELTRSDGGSEFWRFSLSLYADAEVAEACLRLQDEAGADVNLVLFLLWRASQRRSVAAGEIKSLDDALAQWRQEVVVPLRGVRRWLKHHADPVERSAADKLREQVKRIELESERLQQEAVAALAKRAAPGAPALSPQSAAQASLAAYEAVRGRTLPQDVLKVLLGRLAAHSGARRGQDAGGDGNGA